MLIYPVIRMTRWRFTAINESGLPFLTVLCTTAQKYPAVQSAILALAGFLRPWLAQNSAISTDTQRQLASTALERYQSALETLQTKISALNVSQASNDDIVEMLGSVLILITAGFPSDSRTSQDSADWTLHISGIVSLIESLDQNNIQSAYLSRLAREIAAYLDIGAFSLGSLGKTRSRRAWLEWDIEPPGTPEQTDLTPMEIMLGYPKSLVTIIATVAALIECQTRNEVDALVRSTVSRLHEHAIQGARTALSISQKQSETMASTEELFSQLETVLTLWAQPAIPSRVSTPVSLALTSAWEVMRKSTLIYMWRGGFHTNVTVPLSPRCKTIVARFIREMILDLKALLDMFDEQRITIMNIMTWPTVVIANECSHDPGLQAEIIGVLQGMYRRFGIQHIKYIITVSEELWRRTEHKVNSFYPINVSMEDISREMGLCLPLF